MPNFNSPEGELTDVFMTDPSILESFVGNELWIWGNNNNGALGDNTIIHRSSPVQTISGGTNWKQVACGTNFTAAIKTDGTLWTWGRNFIGQLGDNTIIHRSSPVQTISGGTNWKQAACGTSQTTAIKTDGTLWLWGFNFLGQLGDNTQVHRSSPVQTISGGTNWKQVACGTNFTAAIKTDGTLWTWGINNVGQLGDNTTTSRSSPVQTISGGTNWKQVACGTSHTTAIKTDGTLWLWGFNFFGQLGDNTTTDKSSPVQTVSGGTNWKQVACGQHHTAAIKTDGTLWMWGRNRSSFLSGQLGDNTTIHRSFPVQTVSGGTNWKFVSGGQHHTAAIKTDGTLWAWGYNNNGVIGDNTTTDKSSPVQTISRGTNWKMIACGGYFTAAVTYAES